jgi:hypothetical protein
MFERKLSLLDIETLESYRQQSSETVDLYFLVGIEGEQSRERLEEVSLVLMSVEE